MTPTRKTRGRATGGKRGKGLGRVQFWDARNEDYLLGDVRPGLPAVARGLHASIRNTLGVAAVAPVARKSRKWRALWNSRSKIPNDQGPTPRCTAFGTLTALHCLALTHHPRPKVDPQTFYEEIQAIDRAAGRYYDEGATTNAAMEAARARGLIGGYWWAESTDIALDTLVADGATANGTNWYSTMFRRDAEGIIRIGATATIEGGHLWCASGYDPKRGLVRIEQTWGDGVYYLPDADYDRLMREDGECAAMRELPDAPA